MHTCWNIIVWVLISSLSSGPVVAGAEHAIIGKVVASSGASLGGVAIPDGGTITTGDLLSTAKGSSALVKFTASLQASLSEGTSVSFRAAPGYLSAEMSSGTIMIQRFGGKVLVVQTPKFRIEPAGQGGAVYIVAVLPDKTTAVVARRGKISITEMSSGRSYLLPEGHNAVMAASFSGFPAQEKEESKPAPGKVAGQAPESPPEEPKKNNTALIGIVAAGGVGAAVAALAASRGGKGPAVSPSQP